MRSGSIGWSSLVLPATISRPSGPIQGNLDPLALVAGGAAQDRATDAMLEAFGAGPFIFNLGHGILPDTPIAHVERLVARVRGAKS